ncbi:gluconate 2-dehydrogenase subunit 3 family protein [Mucilaginibacter ginsenosidivorans]|uniref:Gluconate 2-dehydrogenase subunit 3 family protein n=1 Tax=Mucilaginibacter ginsenosidivorans TaxID=398053 RepID=A0A5B8V164_9SPHI|nr:gluconate 2-dehydrogenase subunit 3 family protein [Mucilaginibacter ginsenosidivorans]QEC64765.1 gluconate 2-dehydrogenase subunit 3 family protein [Mucilaginibacter ginsenosidivorans]
MNRRDAIGRVALIMGGTMIGAEFLLSGCKPNAPKVADLFNQDHVAFMDEVADTILPDTASSPGAKAAKVGSFMAVMVRDCYETPDQDIFLKGITQIDDASNKKFSKKFMDLDATQRTALLTDLDKEQQEYSKNKKPKDPNHYFRMMKELTLLGYFTSEVGCTKALRYVPVPGRYDGCIPYKKGDKAWALS